MHRPRRIAAFTPYYTAEEAGQVRAAFLAAGPFEGDASVSEFIVRATMREVKRLQRKYNSGEPWPPVKAGELRRGPRTLRVPKPERTATFTPYYTEDEAGQVRAAFLAAGPTEGDASVSEFIVRATMREVKRLQRKHNSGEPWPPVMAGALRRGQRTRPEIQQRDTHHERG